ncbi:MAG TPA: carboxypeptidase-like regulatory domain-containing protein [Aequorivita sp.]|nr:carboxypeptidase-like regulatory domain-containing protein [Aequorivita sp.]
MTKNLLLLLFIIASPVLMAQDITRTKVSGKIHVPQGDDAEGISVYNISSQKGTITDPDGTFEIDLAENDRILISALQYQSFTVIVDKGIVEKRKINIFVNPAVNILEEVVVRPYDLSGNINADVAKIPTYNVTKDWDFSYKNMEYGYHFERDSQTAISGNAAEEAIYGHAIKDGADVLAILGGVGQLLFPKGKKLSVVEREEKSDLLSNNMQQRFSGEFLKANFDIPQDKATDFLYYAQERGLNESLLKPENEMELMEFLLKRSIEYKQRTD